MRFLTWFFVIATIAFSCFVLILEMHYLFGKYDRGFKSWQKSLASVPFLLSELINVSFGLYMICYPWAYLHEGRWIYFAPLWTCIFTFVYGGVMGVFFERLYPYSLNLFMISAGLQFFVYILVVLSLKDKGKGENGCILWPIDPDTQQISCC